jgi:hypothetical protein
MNCRPFQITLAVLVVLTMLVTACSPTAAPLPTARLRSVPGASPTDQPTPTSVPSASPNSPPTPTPIPALQPGCTTYTTDDGLAHNDVYSIAVGGDGELWFGTSDGVSRFDGQTWTTYTTEHGLADNEVGSVALGPDGDLWFGTSGGVSRYDGSTWTTYTNEDGLAHTHVASVAVGPDGALWFGTMGGVSRFDGETWTTYTTEDGLADSNVLSIAVAPGGVVGRRTIMANTGDTRRVRKGDMTKVRPAWRRTTARFLMVVSVVFWLWFGIGSTYVGGPGPLARLMHMPLPGGLIVLSILVAWRWEVIGGVLLVLEGLLALGSIVRGLVQGTLTTSSLTLMCLTLALPPLAAGILFLACWRQSAVSKARHKRSAAGDGSIP